MPPIHFDIAFKIKDVEVVKKLIDKLCEYRSEFNVEYVLETTDSANRWHVTLYDWCWVHNGLEVMSELYDIVGDEI